MKSWGDLPRQVRIYEVGPRDGLQNEATAIPLKVKVQFVNLLADAGLPTIEVTSFVRADAIPQLSDAEEVVAGINRNSRVKYSALIPNMRGMERVASAGLDGIAVFAAASETFSFRNSNATISDTLERFRPVIERARALDLAVRGYVSPAFGCPYEGEISIDSVVRVSHALLDMGAEEIAISDTIGVATPAQVTNVLSALERSVNFSRIALHFHDTRGTALANVLAGLLVGVTIFDSSAGGLGGCPYAPGASGNLSTEDLVYMLDGMGIETGVSLPGVVKASQYLARITGRSPTSRYYHAAIQ
ncbi:MAG: hydroxymethylglutaryl-CoA lyase [Chloroflexota bacterium]